MDNRLFNVNGEGDALLLQTLKLAFAQNQYGERKEQTTGWVYLPEKGLLLVSYSTEKDVQKFMLPLDADEVFPMVKKWLQSDDAVNVKYAQGEWDHDCDHDGHNSMGWRVYVEDWGHVANRWGVICAVKPCYLWHGK